MITYDALQIAKILSDAQERIDDSWMVKDSDINQVVSDLNDIKRQSFEKAYAFNQRFMESRLTKEGRSSFYAWLQNIQFEYKISEDLLVSITLDEAVEKAAQYCDDFQFDKFKYNGLYSGYYDSAMISMRSDCSLISIFSSEKKSRVHKDILQRVQNEKLWLFHVSEGISLDPDDVEYETRSYGGNSNIGKLFKAKTKFHFVTYYYFELVHSPWGITFQ